MEKRQKRHGLFRVLSAFVAVLLVVAAGCVWYVNDYYHAVGVGSALRSDDAVRVSDFEHGWEFDGPGTEDALVFYPGAKVEASAYAPLMHEAAAAGVDCFLVRMPANLAFFGIDRAEDVRSANAYGSYRHWYLAGHSLGGAMAASYAGKHADAWDGLVLLASYSTADLSGTDLRVLSLYGSDDGVLNRAKVREARRLMPKSYDERVIRGGNHAQFGSYGPQRGDGKATISAAKQRARTVAAIREFVTAGE